MSKIRLLILAAMLCLLAASSSKPAKADAGGACLGQWSECRATCEYEYGNSVWKNVCYYDCDGQRNECLAKPPTTRPGAN